ncbi:hypothetical protein D8I35_08750 [Corticibacter populi]|uniref:Uncharacterized protein n=1 Tax=Corticibacter populi TaxID=1550736 RepID=A0A3M6QU86_9BURK|nr:hypothetical protein [Corticibacter populi]RMX06594.1 hypothetical protein D8I35_08750 [Corticibacter populi]RZS31837.1 hypothetical protein EV687_2513 [Corticibacter populi]
MSIGSSGRIVIEVDPDVKRELYAALVRDGSTLKEWFLRNAQVYLSGNKADDPCISLTEVTAPPESHTPDTRTNMGSKDSLANSKKK